jgi:hypothetical protein
MLIIRIVYYYKLGMLLIHENVFYRSLHPKKQPGVAQRRMIFQ